MDDGLNGNVINIMAQDAPCESHWWDRRISLKDGSIEGWGLCMRCNTTRKDLCTCILEKWKEQVLKAEKEEWEKIDAQRLAEKLTQLANK